MAKKVRQVKLVSEDISKNSGKELSHTISKIKAHERLYTFYLVIFFMVVICISAYLGFKVDPSIIYDSNYNYSSFSMSGQLLSLKSKDIMSDAEGVKSIPYTLNYQNTTDRKINFIVRLAVDEDSVKACECGDKIIDYRKIRYAYDDNYVNSFKDESMIIAAGTVKPMESGTFDVRIWLDESLDKNSECYYYGKFVIEELEDMDE